MPTDALINVNGESVQTLEILFLTTVLMLLPSLIIMMTSFNLFITWSYILSTCAALCKALWDVIMETISSTISTLDFSKLCHTIEGFSTS